MVLNLKRSPAESAIGRITNLWVEAIENKNFDAVTAHDDAVAFDVSPPLQIKGTDGVRSHLVNWLSIFDGPAQVHFEDMRIIAGSDIAFFAHAVTRISEGRRRQIVGSGDFMPSKINGEWKIDHRRP